MILCRVANYFIIVLVSLNLAEQIQWMLFVVDVVSDGFISPSLLINPIAPQ